MSSGTSFLTHFLDFSRARAGGGMVMGVSSAIQWWDKWRLHVLVLASLVIHFFLGFAHNVHKSPTLRKLRAIVWITCIGVNVVAIYICPRHPFNRHKRTWDGESSALEVVWAPVLLILLDGEPSITAYSLEDNELWKRHTITVHLPKVVVYIRSHNEHMTTWTYLCSGIVIVV